jgi:hypothetical protein
MARPEAADMMRRRKALAEHPFGTLKCRAGYRHFLMRGFEKVRGEFALMVLCYNFTRVITIIGLERFIARLAERSFCAFYWAILLLADVTHRLGGLKTACGASRHSQRSKHRGWTPTTIFAS